MPGDINTPSPPSTPLSPTPYKIALNRISPGERLIYYLYLPFLFLILFLLALLATLPYLFFKRARPRLLPGSRPDPKHPQSKYEWYGPEKDYPSGLALAPLGQGSGVKWRMWEMYGYFREFWHMTTRQGLQVGGVGSGVVMLIFQVEMMWHDYSANNVSSKLFLNAFLSFSYIQWEADVSDGFDRLQAIKTLRVVEKGIQAMNLEEIVRVRMRQGREWPIGVADLNPWVRSPLFLYSCLSFYENELNEWDSLVWMLSRIHLSVLSSLSFALGYRFLKLQMIGIICICLIGDELLNVRFGCFAPQWYRGGVGYTIML